MSYFLFGLARGPAAPRATTTWSRVQLYKRSFPSPFPVPQSRTVSPPPPPRRNHPAVSNRSHPHTLSPSVPADRPNHRAGLTPMNASRGIDFDGTLVSLFFLHRALPLSWLFPSPPPSFHPPRPTVRISFSPCSLISLVHRDGLAELTGCESVPVVQKHVNIQGNGGRHRGLINSIEFHMPRAVRMKGLFWRNDRGADRVNTVEWILQIRERTRRELRCAFSKNDGYYF